MRNKVLIGLGILVLVIGGCVTCPECPEPSPCPPTVTCPDTWSLETRLTDCEAALTAIVGEGAEIEGPEKPSPPPTGCGPGTIACAEAAANEGEIKTVQGKVVDTHFASSSSGQPTFLNLCYSYEDPRRFTALIWGEDRQKFIDCLGGPPENILLGHEVCGKGLIEIYNGIPEIILKECHQLEILQ